MVVYQFAPNAKSTLPAGIICIWSGTIASIPAGWQLCDGTNSTPDLRDKFIVCASQDSGGVAKTFVNGLAFLQSGGQASHAHNVSGSTDSAYDVLNSGADIDAGASPVFSTTMIGHGHMIDFGTTSTNTQPPFYAWAYIMKL